MNQKKKRLPPTHYENAEKIKTKEIMYKISQLHSELLIEIMGDVNNFCAQCW